MLVASFALAAQEDAAVTDPSAAENTEIDADPPTPASSSEPAASPETLPSANNDSPFDYRSTEQISEDNSVSFPVDI